MAASSTENIQDNLPPLDEPSPVDVNKPPTHRSHSSSLESDSSASSPTLNENSSTSHTQKQTSLTPETSENMEPDDEKSQDFSENEEDEFSNNANKGFASAFRSIMSREISSKDTPVLIERPELAESIKKSKEDAKEKNKERLKRKLARDSGHEIPDILKKEEEKKLKKIAKSGVLKLFNAIVEYNKSNGEIPSTHKEYKRNKKIKHAAVAKDEEGKTKFLKILKKSQ